MPKLLPDETIYVEIGSTKTAKKNSLRVNDVTDAKTAHAVSSALNKCGDDYVMITLDLDENGKAVGVEIIVG